MTKNQLKLRIWNVLNRNKLSENLLASLINTLSENELGAFVDLFSETTVASSFIDRCKEQKDAEAAFSDISDCKAMAARYYDLVENTGVKEFRAHVNCDYLENLISFLQEDINSFAGGPFNLFAQNAVLFLDYLKILRAKVDTVSLDVSLQERKMLDIFEQGHEKDCLIPFLRVILMYYDFVVDVARLEKIFLKNKEQISELIEKEWQNISLIDDFFKLLLYIGNSSEED